MEKYQPVLSNEEKARSWDSGRISLLCAKILLGLFVVHLLAVKIQIALGRIPPLALGDIGEFLLFLGSVVLFVVGALREERETDVESSPPFV